jgi:hypothetical protein
LQKLSAEFRDQGLVVVGLSVGEETPVVEAFLKSMPLAYPNAIAADQLISDLSVNAFPTVVLIDREGKIASYEVGTRGEAALRADLAKLGLTH